ncbi:MobC family plasmid mobilization relaxosome protein [Embleya sp. NPDC059237]|uniref:MobC family plasmid mobilization relaxosome protein n=1 Tax=Embleya sp. NPDC059237 TaxID=3346784 RepID=UPI00368B2C6E
MDAAVAVRGGSKSEFIVDAARAAVRADRAGRTGRGRSARGSGTAATAWFTVRDLVEVDAAAERCGHTRSAYIADATLTAAHAVRHKDTVTDAPREGAVATDPARTMGVPERQGTTTVTVDPGGTRALVEAVEGLSAGLRRVGVNLNQVARATNTTGVAEHAEAVLDNVDRAATRIHAFLDSVDLGAAKKKGV